MERLLIMGSTVLGSYEEELEDLARGKHAKNKQVIDLKKIGRSCVAMTMGGIMLTGFMSPSAYADVMNDDSGPSTAGAVVAVRTFPKVNTTRINLLTEAVSAGEVDGEWSLGGNESSIAANLTKQAQDHDAKVKAQREAEARKKAEEEARKKAEEAARKAQEEAASKSLDHTTLKNNTNGVAAQSNGTQPGIAPLNSMDNGDAVPSSTEVQALAASSKGAAIAKGAESLVGGSMDCTMLATLALQKGTGVYFHGWPEDYKNFPGAVETSWRDAQPGDILVYRDGTSYDMNGPGHADHVAIYIGNGMAVHGGWMGSSVAIASAVTSQGAPEHVYRVM